MPTKQETMCKPESYQIMQVIKQFNAIFFFISGRRVFKRTITLYWAQTQTKAPRTQMVVTCVGRMDSWVVRSTGPKIRTPFAHFAFLLLSSSSQVFHSRLGFRTPLSSCIFRAPPASVQEGDHFSQEPALYTGGLPRVQVRQPPETPQPPW